MIVVLTDPRRTEYLASTLASVDQSATDPARIVLVDGAAASAPDPWRVVSYPKPITAPPRQNRWTTWRAFELAAEASEDLLMFEDDVQGSARQAEVAPPAVRPPQRIAASAPKFEEPAADASHSQPVV